MDDIKYYKVLVKMGHVGKDKYLPMELVFAAANEKKAAELARRHGGVKRDHVDWCLKIPEEINYEEFLEKLEIINSDPYWDGRSRQNIKKFKHRLVKEKHYSRKNKRKINKKTYEKVTPKEVKKYKRDKQEPIDI